MRLSSPCALSSATSDFRQRLTPSRQAREEYDGQGQSFAPAVGMTYEATQLPLLPSTTFPSLWRQASSGCSLSANSG